VLVGRPDDYNPAEWPLKNLTYFQNITDDELRNLYGSVDLLVHPSVGEGITLVVSECMACSTPVIISEESLHEINERDRKLFFSVDPNLKNVEQTLVSALKNINKLDELRIRIREFALTRLSWRKVSEEYLAILNAMILKM
jgi:alpha-maltose-1-phosphate synthase